MERYFGFLALVLLFISCSKEHSEQPQPQEPPVMDYVDLQDVTIKFGQLKAIDLNADGINDLFFSTALVGDPVARVDKRQFYANGAFDVFSLVDEGEQTPVLKDDDAIKIVHPAGYHWYNASSLVMAQKIIGETGPARWDGNWKNADHKFLAVQVRKNGFRYNGWVELSFRTDTEAFILHRAAISRDPGRDIRAGQ